MMEDRPSNNNSDERELLAFAQELETMLGPVPPREEQRARANRSAFLTAAAGQFTPVPSRWQGWWRRLLLQGASLLLFFTVSWVSVRAASASSLPGDTLYPVKLTMEQVDLLFYDKDQWESQVQNRRLAEVISLVQSGRIAQVEFQGTLEQAGDGSWQIDGIPLDFEPEAQALMRRMCGPVRVQGVVAEGEFQLLYLTPSCLSLEAADRPSFSPIPTPLIVPPPYDTPSGEPITGHAVI